MALFLPGLSSRWRLHVCLAASVCLAIPTPLLLSFLLLGDVLLVRGSGTFPISAAARVPSASFVPSTIVRIPASISCDRPSALIAVGTTLLPRASALSIAMSLR